MKAWWHPQALLRDRLVWFIAVGALLFTVDWTLQKRDEKRILIDLPLVEKLATQWQSQTKSPPSPHQLDALIEGYIREEILVREARNLGLDDDDVIIRRRLAQKVDFVLGDVTPPELPDKDGLRAHYEANLARYTRPERISFRHVFAASQAQAAGLLKQLQRNDRDWRETGEPFMLNREYVGQSQTTLAQNFGGDFATGVFAMHLPDQRPDQGSAEWQGPLRSAYGWHVVQVTSRDAQSRPPFEALIEKLALDWQQEQAVEARRKAYRDLRSGYRIEMVPIEAVE